MAKHSRATRRVRSGNRELLWVTILFNGVAAGVTTATIPLPLVLPGDWARGATVTSFQKGATLLGVRGWLSTNLGVTTTGTFNSYFMALQKGDIDEAAGTHNFNVVAPYNSEDLLWTAGGSMSQGAAAAAAATPIGQVAGIQHDINIKAKRKLTTDDVINFWFTTSTANSDWFVAGVLRALVQLPG